MEINQIVRSKPRGDRRPQVSRGMDDAAHSQGPFLELPWRPPSSAACAELASTVRRSVTDWTLGRQRPLPRAAVWLRARRLSERSSLSPHTGAVLTRRRRRPPALGPLGMVCRPLPPWKPAPSSSRPAGPQESCHGACLAQPCVPAPRGAPCRPDLHQNPPRWVLCFKVKVEGRLGAQSVRHLPSAEVRIPRPWD